jgi:hypothetical protein
MEPISILEQMKKKHHYTWVKLAIHVDIAHALTLYSIACISEQLDVAKYLIHTGCDVSLVDAEHKTAFEQADKSFREQLY